MFSACKFSSRVSETKGGGFHWQHLLCFCTLCCPPAGKIQRKCSCCRIWVVSRIRCCQSARFRSYFNMIYTLTHLAVVICKAMLSHCCTLMSLSVVPGFKGDGVGQTAAMGGRPLILHPQLAPPSTLHPSHPSPANVHQS